MAFFNGTTKSWWGVKPDFETKTNENYNIAMKYFAEKK
jgi:hypothetical protein